MTADLPDRAADRERECICCPPGKRPAIEHAKGCPRRARRTVPLSALSVGEQIAALAARPAPDDGEALPGPLDDRCGCRRGMGRRDPACHSYGLCDHAAPSTPPTSDTLRQAVADELARHADQMAYGWDGDTVRLSCRCGHDRGTCTKRELAADLDGRMREYRLHVADAVLAVLDGVITDEENI